MVERITIPEFEITSCPKISFEELKTRIFHLKFEYDPIKGEELAELLEETRIANKNW